MSTPDYIHGICLEAHRARARARVRARVRARMWARNIPAGQGQGHDSWRHPVLSIFNPHEKQSMGRGGDAGLCPVLGIENAFEIVRVAFAETDFGKGADDIAHHKS